MRSVGYSALVEGHSDSELVPVLSSPPRLVLVVHTLAAGSRISLLPALNLSNVPYLVVIRQNSHEHLVVHMDAGVRVSGDGERVHILEPRMPFVVTVQILRKQEEEEAAELT